MGNTQSALGQLTRPGVQTTPMQKSPAVCKNCGKKLLGGKECNCRASRESGVQGMKWGERHAEHGQFKQSAARNGKNANATQYTSPSGNQVQVSNWKGTGKFDIHETPTDSDKGDAPKSSTAFSGSPDEAKAFLQHKYGIDHKGVAESRKRPALESRRLSDSSGLIQRFLEQEPDPRDPTKKVRVALVAIIEEGLGNSKDKNYYSGEALTKAVPLFNGSKAYADHPDAIEEKALPERSMKDFVGWYSNCYADKNPNTGKIRLCGKLHFFPSATWLVEKIETILSNPDAPKDLFGISINAVGKTRPAMMDGEQVNYVEEFQRVDSADVVTEPAARGGFLKMLESKHGSKVSNNMRKRMRESAIEINPQQLKKVADSLTAAHQSDDPDEMKDALYEASKALYEVSSISGNGPGQANEDGYNNSTPYNEGEDLTMKKGTVRKVKASRPGGMLRKGKRFQAAAGDGADNEDLGEPSPEDIPEIVKESDTRDAEDENDLGEFNDFGDGSKFKKNSEAFSGGRQPRRQVAQEGLEDEGFEDEGMEGLEDEGMEDEGEEMYGGQSSGSGGAPPIPAGNASMQMADDGSDDGMDDGGDGMDDDGVDDDMDQGMGEGMEAEEDEALESLRIRQPKRKMQASGRRGRIKSKEAGIGDTGKSGEATLPSHAIGEYDEDYDDGPVEPASGVGKSYAIKTSRFSRNKEANHVGVKVAKEANRRIGILAEGVRQLRESVRRLKESNRRYSGIISFHNSKIEARKLLREAVKKEIVPVGYARTIESDLWGLSRNSQIKEIKKAARFLESTGQAVLQTVQEETIDGIGARGSVAFRESGTAEGHSGLANDLANSGIPMKRR